jgi:hypothetical protein
MNLRLLRMTPGGNRTRVSRYSTWSEHASFDVDPSLVSKGRGSSVGVATGWTDGVLFPAKEGIFLYSTASRPALGLNQPLIRRVPRDLSPWVK